MGNDREGHMNEVLFGLGLQARAGGKSPQENNCLRNGELGSLAGVSGMCSEAGYTRL